MAQVELKSKSLSIYHMKCSHSAPSRGKLGGVRDKTARVELKQDDVVPC